MAEIFTKTRKRKVSIIYESSSSDEKETPSDESNGETDQPVYQSTPRSSERLQKKRCRAYRKPSRDDVWKKITPTKSPGKYDELRPKRLVNNYTKENNSYNYDPNETSGDESMNDFLDDSIEEQSSSESDNARRRNKEKQKVRIKGRHRRLKNRSSLGDSSSTDSDGEKADTVMKNVGDDMVENIDGILSGDSAICVESGINREIDKVTESDNNDGDSDDETENVAVRKKQNRSVIESDENDVSDNEGEKHKGKIAGDTQEDNRLCKDDDLDDSDEAIAVTRKHNRSIIESDEEDSNGAKDEGNFEKQDSGGSAENSGEEVHGEERTENTNKVLEYNKLSNKTKKIKEKSEQSMSSTSAQKTFFETTNPGLASVTALLSDSENETSSNESVTDSSEDSDNASEDLSDETDTDDDDENGGNSSRVRVRMLKKKNDRKKMFDKLRKERQRKLKKEH